MDLGELYKSNHAISHDAALQAIYQLGYEAGIRDANVPVNILSASIDVVEADKAESIGEVNDLIPTKSKSKKEK